MALKFVLKMYYLFLVGKDKLVKYWDVDKFDFLFMFEVYYGLVWCLVVSM